MVRLCSGVDSTRAGPLGLPFLLLLPLRLPRCDCFPGAFTTLRSRHLLGSGQAAHAGEFGDCQRFLSHFVPSLVEGVRRSAPGSAPDVGVIATAVRLSPGRRVRQPLVRRLCLAGMSIHGLASPNRLAMPRTLLSYQQPASVSQSTTIIGQSNRSKALSITCCLNACTSTSIRGFRSG